MVPKPTLQVQATSPRQVADAAAGGDDSTAGGGATVAGVGGAADGRCRAAAAAAAGGHRADADDAGDVGVQGGVAVDGGADGHRRLRRGAGLRRRLRRRRSAAVLVLVLQLRHRLRIGYNIIIDILFKKTLLNKPNQEGTSRRWIVR